MAPLYSPLTAYASGMQAHDRQQERIRRMGLTPRQLELNRYFSYYQTTQYETRQVSWDGRKVLSPIERETIARSTVLPMGFWDPAGMYDEVPLSLRMPCAPYHLTRAIVKRFTGLLFSAKMHPQIKIGGEASLQTWVEGLVKASRLWNRFAHARNRGGAMGSVAMSFRFRNGRPLIEVHDTRWCTPSFVDVCTGEINALEIRYQYPREERGPDGIPRQVDYWYRRMITDKFDVTMNPAPVGEGDEPDWQAVGVASGGEHGLGECPAVWIRNTPDGDGELDGEPDCLGIFEAQEAIDRLISQADQGAVENADPTLVIESDEYRADSVKKGSRNALKLEKGAGANYAEMSGGGIDSALKVADVHRRNALEVAQCVLDTEEAEGGKTATEIERRYSAMHERGDEFREQYGENGVRPLIGKIVRAAARLRRGGQSDPRTGLRLVPQLSLPPRAQTGSPPAPREMPPNLEDFSDDLIELAWPEWIKRGPQDAQLAATATAAAITARAIDQESAVAYVAPYFGIDDPAQALARLKSEGAAADDALTGGFIAAARAPSQPPTANPAHPPAPVAPPPITPPPGPKPPP